MIFFFDSISSPNFGFISCFFNRVSLYQRAIERSTIDFYNAQSCVTMTQCDSNMQSNTNFYGAFTSQREQQLWDRDT